MNTQKHVFYGTEGRYVSEIDFDRVTAERDALQQLLNVVEEENDRLRGILGDAREDMKIWQAKYPAEAHLSEHLLTFIDKALENRS